jgi:tRNA threonylcarbamoyladenosine biosynthesis protein TsaE
MATYTSHSPEETLALGETWGREAVGGLVIGLTGELGAGKTQLARGVARGLGVDGRVHSPTFALVNEYVGGRLALFHVDLYRLEKPDEIIAAGLEEYFHPAGVSVVEWAERWFGSGEESRIVVADPKLRYRRVRIESVSDTERRITYEDFGS